MTNVYVSFLIAFRDMINRIILLTIDHNVYIKCLSTYMLQVKINKFLVPLVFSYNNLTLYEGNHIISNLNQQCVVY